MCNIVSAITASSAAHQNLILYSLNYDFLSMEKYEQKLSLAWPDFVKQVDSFLIMLFPLCKVMQKCTIRHYNNFVTITDVFPVTF